MAILIFCILAISLFGRNENQSMGARSNGLGNASVTLSDEWAIFNNVAALAALDSAYHFSFYFREIYLLPNFRILGFSTSIPLRKKGVCGLGFYKFGDNLYNEQKITLGFAHQIRNVALGLQMSYVQLSALDHRTRGNVLVEFGGIVTLSSTLKIGAHIYNATQTQISEQANEKFSTVMKLGAQYQAGQKVWLYGEVEKNVLIKESIKMGLEYLIIKNFTIRTGLVTNSTTQSFGFSYKKNQYKFDYAFAWNEKLGIFNHFSIALFVNKYNVFQLSK
jgi:hypothetical protein